VNFDRVKVFGSALENKLVERARRSLGIVGAFLLIISMLSVLGNAQLTTADINGTVYDSSGAVLPNASVTLTNTRTQDIRHTKSNAAGEYSFTFLLPGAYSVKVEAEGFTAFNSTVEISAGDRTKLTLP